MLHKLCTMRAAQAVHDACCTSCARRVLHKLHDACCTICMTRRTHFPCRHFRSLTRFVFVQLENSQVIKYSLKLMRRGGMALWVRRAVANATSAAGAAAAVGIDSLAGLVQFRCVLSHLTVDFLVFDFV